MNKKLITIIFTAFILTLFFGTSTAFATETGPYNDSAYPQAAYIKGIEPPFSAMAAQEENIDTATGNLSVNSTDLVLKGKNGLDLAISRYYNMSQANIWENQIQYSNGTFYDCINVLTSNDYFYNLGTGWSWNIPYVEYRDEAPYPILHYGNGSSFFIDNYDATANKFSFTTDKMQDITLSLDLNLNQFSNGQYQSWYILTQKDGKIMYFATNGVLMGVKDRFGNVITYQYTEQYDQYNAKHYYINSITDSCQRTVNFQYDTANRRIILTVSDGTTTKTINYNQARIIDKTSTQVDGFMNDDELVLDNVVDAEGRTTSYQYNYNTVRASMVTDNLSPSTSTGNMYVCLFRTVYPTGGNTLYLQTNKYTRNCGISGAMEFYKLSSRQSYNANSYGASSSIMNQKLFMYRDESTGEYDGYPTYRDSTAVPDSYIFKTHVVIATGSVSTISNRYTFNKNCLCLNLTTEDSSHKTETLNTYDNRNALIKKIERTYNTSTLQYMEKVQNYTFDDYNNMTGFWDEQAVRDSNNVPVNDEHKTTYTYQSQYNYPIQKTYKKDTSTSIIETYTPTSNNKAVEWSRVYEGGTMKQQTQYLYDSCGNVTEQRDYLDGWASYIRTRYSYLDNIPARNGLLNNVYMTRKWVEGITDADGTAVQAKAGNTAGTVDEIYKYSWFGNLIEKQDGSGNATTYLYDNLNRMTRQTNPDNSYKTWSFACNTAENSVTQTDENGTQIKNRYDDLGNLIYEQDITSGQNINTCAYNILGWLTTETNTNGRTTSYQYNLDGTINSKQVRNAASSQILYEMYTYDPAFNNGQYSKTNKIVFGEGSSPYISTTTYINKYGQLEKQERRHVGASNNTYTDTFVYDYLGNKTEEKSARAYAESFTQPYTAKYEYNYAGKTTKVYNTIGDFTTTAYDAVGRAISVTDIKGNKASPTYSTTYTYDALGRLITEQIPFESVNGTKYYTTKKHYYDLNGNTIKEKTSNNKPGQTLSYSQTGYEYNNRNLLVKVTTYDNSNAINYTQYHYDAVGNKLRMYTGLSLPLVINGLDNVTTTGDANYSVTKYEYNRFGKLTRMTDPLNQVENYTYDLNGNMTQKSDRNGSTTILTYDCLNRLTASVVTNTENPSLNSSLSYTYDFSGNKASMTGNDGTTNYTYDDLGRLITESSPGNITKEYTYDAANNRKSLVIKQNGTVKTNTTYVYDVMNRLYQVSENGQLSATYGYDDNSNRQSLVYNNGDSTSYTYNLANKVKTLTNSKGAATLSSYTYEYSLDGNQTRKTDNTGKTTDYTYDGLERLTNEAPSGETAIGYTYDDANNRGTMTLGSVSTTYTYDKDNRLTAETKVIGTTTEITRYRYDGNGNQVYKATETVKSSGGTETFGASVSGDSTENTLATLSQYDGFNQLVKVTVGDKTCSYGYNADGLRVSKIVNGVTTTHVWDGEQIALELDGSGVIANKYVRGINLIYAEDGSGNNQKWYLFNGHGDVVQLTSTTGDVVKGYDYDAFGNEKNPDINDTNVFRYCGEYFDKETGTIYLRARYYDPEIGRFITKDSYWGKDTDPLSLNLYTYCYNDPVDRIDPSGHIAPLIALAAYLGETALETAPDILIDMLLEGDDFVWWKSALSNYGTNLIPGLGEGKKVYKVARILEKYGPKVVGYITKYGDNALKYIEKNGVDAFADILKKTDVKWQPYSKHIAPKMKWSDVVKSTKSGPAKYLIGTNIEALERKAWNEGMLVTNGNTWKVMKFDNVIGACSGKETKYMRIEYTAGSIHGHPITETEYLGLIR